MSIKWTQQEDNLLKQLDALGYSSSKIYKEYSSILKNRSQNAIALRLSYLHKPPEERRKEDMASFDNADMLEKAINQAADRICNRLDDIANALAVICRDLQRYGKQCSGRRQACCAHYKASRRDQGQWDTPARNTAKYQARASKSGL